MTDPDHWQGGLDDHDEQRRLKLPATEYRWVRIAQRVGLVVVFLWFALGCIPHFKATAMEMSIMPSYIPYPREMVVASGAFELLGAIGILIPSTRRAAGIGLFLLTIAVTPANVFMLQHAERYNWPMWLLIFRLPFQAFLLWLVWWTTWDSTPKVKTG